MILFPVRRRSLPRHVLGHRLPDHLQQEGQTTHVFYQSTRPSPLRQLCRPPCRSHSPFRSEGLNNREFKECKVIQFRPPITKLEVVHVQVFM